jgi:hypothetical protein
MSLFKKFGKWVGRRAGEGSTYAGIVTVIAPIVATKLGLPVEDTALILTKVIGGIMIGATSRNHPPLSEQV